jgi:hypothetical protein
MRDEAAVVIWVLKLLSEDPFPPRVVQTLAALAAFATHFPAVTRRLGSVLRATANPGLGEIPAALHQDTNCLATR